MKPLHLLKSDGLHPYTDYVKIVEDKVVGTDGFVLFEMPAKNVFGVGVILPEDHLYINVREWHRFKFDKAERIDRQETTFTAFDKKTVRLGKIKALTEAEYANSFGRYPDYKPIFPESPTSEIDSIAFDPELLLRAVNIFSLKTNAIHLNFRGKNKGITIDVWDRSESKIVSGRLLVMPRTWDI